MSVVLTAAWLGLCAAAQAQPQPAPTQVLPPPAPAAGQTQPQPAPATGAAPDAAHGTPHPMMAGPEMPMMPGCDLLRVPMVAPLEPACPPGPYVPRLHFGAEYLYWFLKKDNLPPLVTAGNLEDFIPSALGQPGTDVVTRGPVSDSRHHGVRFTLAYNFEHDPSMAVEANFFFLAQRGGNQRFTSNGNEDGRVIGRPFYNVGLESEDADPVAVPGVAAGAVALDFPRKLYGGEANLLYHFAGMDTNRFVWLVGFRTLLLREGLHVTSASDQIPGFGVPGGSSLVRDSIEVSNDFFGGQIGGIYQFQLGPIMVNTTAKAAFGPTYKSQRNSAFTEIVVGRDQPVVGVNQGLLVQPSNAGKFSRTVYSIVPEASVNLAIMLNQHIRFGVGYTFLYWTNLARVGNVLDRGVTLLPVGAVDGGQSRPAPQFGHSDFYVHGLNAHLSFSF